MVLGETRIKLLAAAALFLTLVGGLAAQTRPNIVLILADDMSTMDIDDRLPSSPGATLMPNLRQFVIEPGLTFTRSYVTEALCCPSRVTILRGQYPHNTQIIGNTYPQGGFARFYELGGDKSTIGTWLQAAGYRTLYVGKYMNGYPQPPPGVTLPDGYVPPGWNEWYGWIDVGHRFLDYDIIENGQRVHYGTSTQDYNTDVLSRKAAEALDRTTGPFFLFLAPIAPHEPARPAERHRTLFSNIRALRSPSFNEADMFDKPWPYRSIPLRTEAQINEMDELHRNRLRSLMAIDDMIKVVIDKLQQKGQLANTYIFFTSDHGFHMGEHRMEPGKNTNYEEDIKVPLFVTGPGVRKGQQDQIVLNNDLAPTFADLAGATIPSDHIVDGRSLRPLLSANGNVQPWRTNFWIKTTYDYIMGGLRTISPSSDTLYAEYRLNDQPMSNLNRELYDMTTDPYQMRNAYEGANRTLISHLAARLASFRNCAGASCIATEDAPIGPPQISGNGLVNAASYVPNVSPGSLISIFGTDLSRNVAAAQSTPLPTTLGGVTVTIGGRQAPLVYVSPTQINAQLPYEIPEGNASVIVRAANLETAAVNVRVTAASPGVFMLSNNRPAIQNQDGSLHTNQNPAPAGNVVVVYLTGMGQPQNPVATGERAPTNPLARSRYPVTATVAGQPAEVLYAGLAPGWVGLMQVNVRLPQLPSGAHPLAISMNGASSNLAVVSIR
jgi:N-acetylglucosamine-6-sulfatase